jgi:pimeloyl-ACP methyl ester carboxylesterase
MKKERIVFVHGAGPAGAAAWPNQHKLALPYDCLFLKRAGFEEPGPPVPDYRADVDSILELLEDGGHVVAHAEGAVPAMMAAVERPDLVRSLALMEPAPLSLTRDLPVTESYIAGNAALPGQPWEAPLDLVPGVPTLVETGAWEPLYEEVAEYLAATGAKHLHAGGNHRPQDTAEGHQALLDFIRANGGWQA